jgi:hypothetical protein
MPRFEFGGHGRYIFAPRESIFAAIIHQTLRGQPQIIELVLLYFLTFSNCGQCGLRHAAMCPFCFEIDQGLIVVRRIGFMPG